MVGDITFTNEAIERLTSEQSKKIRSLNTQNVKEINLFIAFELPDDYIAVKITYMDGGTLFGGIDKYGAMST